MTLEYMIANLYVNFYNGCVYQLACRILENLIIGSCELVGPSSSTHTTILILASYHHAAGSLDGSANTYRGPVDNVSISSTQRAQLSIANQGISWFFIQILSSPPSSSIYLPW